MNVFRFKSRRKVSDFTKAIWLWGVALFGTFLENFMIIEIFVNRVLIRNDCDLNRANKNQINGRRSYILNDFSL
jgi:hypothetical protein